MAELKCKTEHMKGGSRSGKNILTLSNCAGVELGKPEFYNG